MVMMSDVPFNSTSLVNYLSVDLMDNHGEEGGGGGCLGGGRGGFVLGRTGHDCRSRDIRRRLEVIQKKMTDLQELGVPCAFCYASVRNTGSLFAMGDSAITQVIEGCSDEILQQLSKNYSHQSAPISLQRNGEIRVVLPPLSGPIDELGFIELRALVVGIVKDLQLRWTDPRPSFWPSDVPFQNPRTVSGVHQGKHDGTIIILCSVCTAGFVFGHIDLL